MRFATKEIEKDAPRIIDLGADTEVRAARAKLRDLAFDEEIAHRREQAQLDAWLSADQPPADARGKLDESRRRRFERSRQALQEYVNLRRLLDRSLPGFLAQNRF